MLRYFLKLYSVRKAVEEAFNKKAQKNEGRFSGYFLTDIDILDYKGDIIIQYVFNANAVSLLHSDSVKNNKV